MAMPKSTNGTDRITLHGSVSLHVLFPVLSEIERAARKKSGTHFQLDCSAVTDISSEALAELMRLRGDVRVHRCDLILTQCSLALTTSIQSSIFRSLLDAVPAVKKKPKAPTLQGPHTAFQAKWKRSPARKRGQPREPYFLRLHGTRFQRFWLN
jgi:ABC-type transporter Mla MlaB component